jgi:hypothetical protein
MTKSSGAINLSIAVYPLYKKWLYEGWKHQVIKKDIKGRIRDDIVQGHTVFVGPIAYRLEPTPSYRVISDYAYVNMYSSYDELERILAGAVDPTQTECVLAVKKALEKGLTLPKPYSGVYRENNSYIAWFDASPLSGSLDLEKIFDTVEPGIDWLVKRLVKGIHAICSNAVKVS